MKVAAWNVNSIKSRLQHLKDWSADFHPDVVLLQELKCQDPDFPYMEIEEMGYHCAVFGQKAYNGVAILSKIPIKEVRKGIPGFQDEQSRYIEADLENGITVSSIYVPNGSEIGSDKYQYKMSFYAALHAYLKDRLSQEKPFVMGGDFNVAKESIDIHDPDKVGERILCSQAERHHLNSLINLGYADSYRVFEPHKQYFSWWDYRAGSWDQDKGWRIDYVLTCPYATDMLTAVGIDKTPRGWEKPSDHTPVWVEIS